MGSRIDIDTAELRSLKPRGLVGDDLRVDHMRDMTADRIIRKCRRVLILPCDLAVRNKPELDQCLEAVADTQSQTIPLVQKLFNSLTDLRIPESRRKELRGAVRLVAGRESAREHDDLCLFDLLQTREYLPLSCS